jgi:hypothetical protein
VTTIQAAFICGRPAILLMPLTTKTGTPSRPEAKLEASLAEAVVEKNFVDDERERSNSRQRRASSAASHGLVKCPVGLFGCTTTIAAGAGGDRASYRLRIDLPALVVDERRGFEAHIVERGEKVEERISGLCDEDFIAGIAKQAEEEAVRLAGAGGEQQLVGIERHAVAGVVFTDSLARGENAFGLRIVVKRAGIGERLEQGAG